MAEYRREEGSRFVVDLGSVRLPALTEKRVETEIRGAVLRALAESDFRSHPQLSRRIFDRFPGRTLGLWLDPDQQVPGPFGPLEPADHTLIVREVMTYPFHVMRALGVSKGDPKPSGRQVLEATLDIDEIDAFAKERIRQALKVLEQVEPTLAKPSREQKHAVAYVEKLIGGQPLAEQVRLLRDKSRHPDTSEPDWFHQILEWIAQMLEDGASTIYSSDFGFHRILSSGRAVARERDAVDTIKDADTLGATLGGVVGTLVPGVGTGAGAAAVGASSSVGAAVVELLDWIWS